MYYPFVLCIHPKCWLRFLTFFKFLGDNNIPSLNFNIVCLPKLRYLDLEDNNITKFSQRDLDSFDRLTTPYRNENFTLEIGGNPIKCDTAMKSGLYTWLHSTKVGSHNV